MSNFHQLHYHLVWSTRHREPWLTTERETLAYGLLAGKAHALGAFTHAINGMPDHVHMVVRLPPKIAVAAFVYQLKGFSSYELRATIGHFRWQRGYGAFTVSNRQLPYTIAYVRNQKHHHTQSTDIRHLEPSPDTNDRDRLKPSNNPNHV
ncbi:MAG: IS200/IS605 family transposase [Acidobacteriota bacterium]